MKKQREIIPNKTSGIIEKKEVQKILRAFRKDKAHVVEKENGHYKVYQEGQLVFMAMNGHYNYLVSMSKGLLTAIYE